MIWNRVRPWRGPAEARDPRRVADPRGLELPVEAEAEVTEALLRVRRPGADLFALAWVHGYFS